MNSSTENSATLIDLTEQIITMITEEAGNSGLTADSTLQDSGLDSLRVMSLVLKIEIRYDIELDADDGSELRTIGDLVGLVARRLGDRS